MEELSGGQKKSGCVLSAHAPKPMADQGQHEDISKTEPHSQSTEPQSSSSSARIANKSVWRKNWNRRAMSDANLDAGASEPSSWAWRAKSYCAGCQIVSLIVHCMSIRLSVEIPLRVLPVIKRKNTESSTPSIQQAVFLRNYINAKLSILSLHAFVVPIRSLLLVAKNCICTSQRSNITKKQGTLVGLLPCFVCCCDSSKKWEMKRSILSLHF